MPATYESIATYTVTGSALDGPTGLTFTSIPSIYTDLQIVQNVTTTAPAIMLVQINGDTTNNYSVTSLTGSGSSAASDRSSNAGAMSTRVAHTTTTIGTFISNFMNYSNTTTNKTVLFRSNNTAFGTEATVGLYRSTSAITSIRLFLDRSENYSVGSTFTLYGIKAA
jgi:hypothetical protein